MLTIASLFLLLSQEDLATELTLHLRGNLEKPRDIVKKIIPSYYSEYTYKYRVARQEADLPLDTDPSVLASKLSAALRNVSAGPIYTEMYYLIEKLRFCLRDYLVHRGWLEPVQEGLMEYPWEVLGGQERNAYGFIPNLKDDDTKKIFLGVLIEALIPSLRPERGLFRVYS